MMIKICTEYYILAWIKIFLLFERTKFTNLKIHKLKSNL